MTSDSRVKPETKNANTKPVKDLPLAEFSDDFVSFVTPSKHLTQSFSVHLMEASVVSSRSEDGRILRFLIERSEFISVKKQSL